MRIVHLNTYDSGGGAARAALRLHRGLRAAGVDSTLLVRAPTVLDEGVLGPSGRAQRLASLAAPALDALSLRLAANLPGDAPPFSPSLVPDALSAEVHRLGADLVNLHWVAHSFLHPASLRKLGTPVVWTLHDSWAFTGGCHVPGDCHGYRERCGRCPALGSRRGLDLSRWGWHQRRRALEGLDLTVVTPSRWLAERAGESSLLAGRRIAVIPNGIDLGRYRDVPREEARRLLGIPGDRPIVLFAAYGGTGTPNKGFDLLAGALRHVAAAGQAVRLVVMGARPSRDTEGVGVPVSTLGTLSDDVAVALALAASDVVVVPSRQENLPNVVMEAQACGRPVVAFRIGGIPEMVRPGVDGALAEPFDVAGLAEALRWVLGDADRWRRLSEAARAGAQERWGLELQASRYRALYGELTERRLDVAPAPSAAAAGRHD